jgi:predicted RNase H-like HicB family nuclease
MILTVIVEKSPGNWGAYAPNLEDSIIATGDTREEAIQNFRDALLDLMDYKREQGRDTPNITALEIRETREVETLETRLAA